MGRKKKDRLGEFFYSKDDLGGYKYIIIEYNHANDVIVEFQDTYKAKVKTTYQNCKSGGIKNPYHPTAYGRGYIGVGSYSSRDEDGNKTKCYSSWRNIFIRCYDETRLDIFPTYKGCSVNEEVYDFQKFGEWFDVNYYEVEGEKMCLDKDILKKGNKEYSFDTMVFVPERINILFTKSNSVRGEYPIGVTYHKLTNKYCSHLSTLDGNKWLGLFDTVEQAFEIYKKAKEDYIKEVADEYKDRIPHKLYVAMYNWVVEMDD